MNDQRLKQLLADADLSADTPMISSGLAKAVLQKAYRRAMVRQAFGTSAAILLCLAIAWMFWWKPVQPQIAKNQTSRHEAHAIVLSASEIAQANDELVKLDEEAALHERTASAYLKLTRKSKRRIVVKSKNAFLLSQDLIAQCDAQTEEAAHLIVVRGDRLLSQPNDEPAAVAVYRRAIELFPHSAQAVIARERLEQIGASI